MATTDGSDGLFEINVELSATSPLHESSIRGCELGFVGGFLTEAKASCRNPQTYVSRYVVYIFNELRLG